ncbi:MAG: signal peptidase II [Lachnospiraceae bacterium]|nr:signal peptidase II [Lachnospiraceae bacterium]
MNTKKRVLFFLMDIAIIAVLVAIDRFSKIAAEHWLKDKEAVKLISGVFELRYLENRGAAFGMLQDMRMLFIVVGAVFIVAVIYFLIRIPATKKYFLLRACLVLIGAGAIGNLYDRVTLNYVVDFLYFIYIDFPIFNIADIYVTVSAITLVILFVFIYKDEDLDLKEANTVKMHSSMRPVQENEEIETDKKAESDSDKKSGSGSEKKEEKDTDKKPESDSDEKSGSGSEKKEEKDTDKKAEGDSDKKSGSGSEKKEEKDTDKKPESDSDGKSGTGSEKKEEIDPAKEPENGPNKQDRSGTGKKGKKNSNRKGRKGSNRKNGAGSDKDNKPEGKNGDDGE